MILIACEFSGVVRDAFIKHGYDAISCDLLPTQSKGPHIQGNVIDIINNDWDMIIAHPPCTYLTNAGVCHLKNNPIRQKQMEEAAIFFKTLLNNKCTYIILQAKNTIDEKIYYCLQNKKNIVDDLYLELGSQ